MMDDGISLLGAIAAARDDDTPRLAVADWLQENGDAVWAEFIRVQICLARGVDVVRNRFWTEELKFEFLKRQAELRTEMIARLGANMVEIEKHNPWRITFARGFAQDLNMQNITAVPIVLHAGADSGLLTALWSLNLFSSAATDDSLDALASLTCLRRLFLGNTELTESAFERFAASPNSGRLSGELYISSDFFCGTLHEFRQQHGIPGTPPDGGCRPGGSFVEHVEKNRETGGPRRNGNP